MSPVPKGPTFGYHHSRGFVPSIDSTFRLAPRFCSITNKQNQKKGKALAEGDTNIRKLDFADLAPPNKSRHFVLLPCFDSCSVPGERVEMVEAVSFVSLPSRKTVRTKRYLKPPTKSSTGTHVA